MWAYAALAAAQVIGGYQQAAMIRKSADIKSGIAEMNAKYADLDAYNATNAGISAGARQAASTNQVIGKQRTALAGAGVSVDYGTAQDIQADSKVQGMLNTLELQRQGREKALGYQVQAINTRLGGQMTQLQGEMDAGAAIGKGVMGGFSTLVGGQNQMESTGKGQNSRTGTSDQAWTAEKSVPQGNIASGNQPSWFFGTNPRGYSQPSQYSQPVMGSQYSQKSSGSLFSDSDWGFGG